MYKTVLTIALILFVGAIVIQYIIKDMPLSNKLAYILNEISEVLTTLAAFFSVASMAWIIALL